MQDENNEQPTEEHQTPQSASLDAELNELDRDLTFAAKPTPEPTPTDNPIEQKVNLPIIMQPPSKSKKMFKWGGLGVLVIVLISAAAFAVYYYLLRIPDIQYQKAIDSVEAMKTNAKALADYGNDAKGNSEALVDVEKISIAQSNVAEYNTHLKELENSTVMKKDTYVKADYAIYKQKIEDYGSSSKVLFDSFDVFATLSQKCSTAFGKVEQIKTIDEYDSIMKDCQTYAQQHPTVENKAFNDTYYTKYRNEIPKLISDFRTFFVATFSHDTTGVTKATAVLDADEGQFETAGTSESNGESTTISNTFNPGDQLSNLENSIRSRQATFFRW